MICPDCAIKTLEQAADEFQSAALAGIEPVLNMTVSRLLRKRALRITPGTRELKK